MITSIATHNRAPVAALLAILAAGSGCASGTDTQDESVPTSVMNVATITITDFAYTVGGTVAPRAVVTVTNDDAAEHSVTSDNGGAFDTDVDGRRSATFTAPKTPGTYALHCTYHSQMRGVLVVQ